MVVMPSRPAASSRIASAYAFSKPKRGDERDPVGLGQVAADLRQHDGGVGRGTSVRFMMVAQIVPV